VDAGGRPGAPVSIEDRVLAASPLDKRSGRSRCNRSYRSRGWV